MSYMTKAAIFALFIHFVASFALKSQIFNKETDTRIVSSGASMMTTKAKSGFECAIMCTNDNNCWSCSYNTYLEQCQFSCSCSPTMEHHNGSYTFIKTPKSVPARDCSELPDGTNSGVYCIQPEMGSEIAVFCEMNIDDGGWTTIQRRYDGTVDFYRFWDDYKSGFGDIAGEHWLGNDNLHAILRQGSYQVRFDLEDFTGDTSYAMYDTIYVGDESTNYMLLLMDYSGTAGNAMVDLDPNHMFTARDRDNDLSSDLNCGIKKESGWWHTACTSANINGGYGEMYNDT
ncbi:Angiopoietin-related protein 7,Angiopoietin-related protein 1,Ficolin-3,Ficolin-1-B,Ficolin-2,Ryncolin-1,Tenascin-R,Fibrinogen-like protein 1,Angiopoietin-related protein 4,Ficolin-1,Fibrinogen C domain-containing protein 1-A,Ryncolin-3,Fibroleukin,Fibrinogen C domain-containing protein 1,Ryncolin-2,Techylectin-5B,Angiopoietin-related protein 2,Tenascin,Fibrinogen C domain-containing protein 1-B,Angiopoietin-4 [Mytilus coruscus]|uniref:Fibrinogen C-terminal domain-containing protein n=1 Tax=Mytilus coruscus TaxID=42192 RepID=A0A6J7ZW71_MYTCO|nr:Angiopoietin-related protein 7,Angiopoietin-related protein 1,Ficolin-3,Ficolin-1-B,Ficolin-2,Ryncolin-1,Tenascin-R,Fibrinogen-like protein 1,Angiopoietin-related protein 4,Ficolin-1,Fibrinogen C domain-containing protein 1-A,Ryncolin-3,Fibroleukin,Fibrinogen C domain-containing protein 1,Ryncolin-2,Techylectin-5B,Angiopoietin-related protein 2,Tenascin,Fibrinogen C domain-containing protein 1-B,Angiopoietin-4 [Mytilus coruscus]